MDVPNKRKREHGIWGKEDSEEGRPDWGRQGEMTTGREGGGGGQLVRGNI